MINSTEPRTVAVRDRSVENEFFSDQRQSVLLQRLFRPSDRFRSQFGFRQRSYDRLGKHAVSLRIHLEAFDSRFDKLGGKPAVLDNPPDGFVWFTNKVLLADADDIDFSIRHTLP